MTGVAGRFARSSGRWPSTSATATSACSGSPGSASPSRAGASRSPSASTGSRSAAPSRSASSPWCASLPGALASPFAGLLGDRFPRRDVLIGSGLAVTVVLAARRRRGRRRRSAGGRRVFAGVFTVAVSGYVPAEAALLPALARTPQELSAANVTHSAMDNVGFLLAALATGVLLAVADPGGGLRRRRRGRLPDHDRADDDRARPSAPATSADGELSRPRCASRRSASAPCSSTRACACSARRSSCSSSSRASPRSWS